MKRPSRFRRRSVRLVQKAVAIAREDAPMDGLTSKKTRKEEKNGPFAHPKALGGATKSGRPGKRDVVAPKSRRRTESVKKVTLERIRFQVGDDVYIRRPDAELEEEEEEGCLVCSRAGELVECNGCSGGVHLACADPPLDEVPEDDWLCSNCSQSGTSTAATHTLPWRPRANTARQMLLSSKLWAARILRMWKEADGSYWFRGQWYIIPEETAIGRQPHNVRRELFRTDQVDENEMASILRHCYVMSPEDFRNAGQNGDDVYLCEYEYDTRFHTFKRIVEIEEDFPPWHSDGSEYSGGESESDDGEGKANPKKRKKRGVFVKKKLPKSSTPRAVNSRRVQGSDIWKVGTKKIPESVRKKVPQTDFERAKSALRLTAIPGFLPCREKEIREITAFVTDALASGDSCLGRCLYISGVPGTGKTATVLEAMKSLHRRVEAGELHPYRFVEINGLRLASPEHLYTVLYEALTGHHLGWKKALQLLDERFSQVKALKQIEARPCILLIDELDLLVTRNQSVLYNIFDWPSRPKSRLFVIGIANTIDLPERLLPRIASRMGLQRISFNPYTFEQLQQIISSRLQGIHAFERNSIEFASRKVAAVSGDARRALELCRRAVELAESCSKCVSNNSNSKYEKNGTGYKVPDILVRMEDVENAIQEMFQAAHIKMIKRLPRYSRIFLVVMVYEQHKTGMAEITFEKIAQAFSHLCKSNGEKLPDWDRVLAIGCGLGACRLLLCEPGAQHRLQKLQLNFPSDDVCFALKEDAELPWLAKYF